MFLEAGLFILPWDFQTPAQCAVWRCLMNRMLHNVHTHCHFLFLHIRGPPLLSSKPCQDSMSYRIKCDFSMSGLKLLPCSRDHLSFPLFSHSLGYFWQCWALLLRGFPLVGGEQRLLSLCRAWTSHCTIWLLQSAGQGMGGFNTAFCSRAQPTSCGSWA